jgi:hypothetical protein
MARIMQGDVENFMQKNKKISITPADEIGGEKRKWDRWW